MNILQLKAFAEQHNPWKCRVYSTIGVSVANGSFTVPPMNVIDFDPSGMVTTGNTAANHGYITIPVDGIYQVTCDGALNTTSDGTRLVVSIYKNNAEFKRGFDWTNGAATPMVGQCNAIMYCKAGDVLNMAQFTSTAAMSTVAAGPYMFMSVAYLCAA